MLLFLITQGFVSAQFILRDGYVSDLGMPWSYLWEAQPDSPSWEMRTKSYEPTFGGIRPIGAQIKNGGRDLWATALGPIWESLGEEKKGARRAQENEAEFVFWSRFSAAGKYDICHR